MKNMKKNFRIRTNCHYGERSKPEYNSGKIMVVPNQSYTIDEILEKFTRGIPLDISREVSYSDSDDFDDVDERTYITDLSDFEEIEASMAARRRRRSAKDKKPDESAKKLADEQFQPDSKP